MMPKVRNTPMVMISARVYQVLLASYPSSFQQEYAPHMLQTFQDYTRTIYQHRGIAGILWWWALTLFDYLTTVTEEHLQRITFMSKSKLIRMGGWALMAVSLVMVFAFGVGELYDTPFGQRPAYELITGSLWLLIGLLSALGFLAIRSRYRPNLGGLGNSGLLLGVATGSISAAGIMVYTMLPPAPDLSWGFFIMGLLGSALALMLFGLEEIRKRHLPRWHVLPLIGGAVPLLLFIMQMTLEYGLGLTINFDMFFPIAIMVMVISIFLTGFAFQAEPGAEMAPA
jgi:hypothetical protein